MACGWAPEGRPSRAPSCGARRPLGAGKLEAKEKEGQGASEKGAAGGVFGALAFLRLAGRGRVACVYLLLLVDQILQTGLDWVLLVAALQVRQSRSLFSFNWHFATCWVNLMLKVVLARAAASCCAAAGETFHRQWLLRVTKATNASASQVVARDMKVVDIGLSHQVWVLFAMLCSTLGLLCLVHVRLPQPLFGLLLALPAYATACWCLLKSFRQRVDFHRKQCACKSFVCKLLHDCFAPGMAARLMAKDVKIALCHFFSRCSMQKIVCHWRLVGALRAGGGGCNGNPLSRGMGCRLVSARRRLCKLTLVNTRRPQRPRRPVLRGTLTVHSLTGGKCESKGLDGAAVSLSQRCEAGRHYRL